MNPENQTPDSHIAYGAAADGVAAARRSIAIVGRYWWNLQMQLLVASGTMRFFRAHWWLFLIVGFLLMAFVLPLGLAFLVSAFCAGEMNPKAQNDYIVPLKHKDSDPLNEHLVHGFDTKEEPSKKAVPDDVLVAAGLHHATYLRAAQRNWGDKEFAAAALGAFDGTVQAFGLRLTDTEMHLAGSVFMASQLKDLGRMDDLDPDFLAEVTADAMASEALEEIRAEAGRMAYAMAGATR